MNFSPALNKNYISKNFNVEIEEYNLDEVVRQKKDSGILKNATHLRNNVIKNIPKEIELVAFNDVKSIHPDKAVLSAKESYKPYSFADFVVTHSRALALFTTKEYDRTYIQIFKKNY